MEEMLIHKFNYKGYIIIIAKRDGVEWIYPIHETYDLEDDVTPNCKSVEVCIQWIDEDVKCRAEEEDREKRAGLNPEAIADILLDDMEGYGQNIKEMLTWYLEKRPECLREWQDWLLETDVPLPKSCFNHCPKCGATDPANTTHEKIIYVKKKDLEEIECFLNPMRKLKTDEVYQTFTADFGDCGEGEVSIDIKLVDSRDGTAYIDPVMFQDGSEVGCLEVRDAFNNETFLFSGYLKDSYVVKIREMSTRRENLTKVQKRIRDEF